MGMRRDGWGCSAFSSRKPPFFFMSSGRGRGGDALCFRIENHVEKGVAFSLKNPFTNCFLRYLTCAFLRRKERAHVMFLN